MLRTITARFGLGADQVFFIALLTLILLRQILFLRVLKQNQYDRDDFDSDLSFYAAVSSRADSKSRTTPHSSERNLPPFLVCCFYFTTFIFIHLFIVVYIMILYS